MRNPTPPAWIDRHVRVAQDCSGPLGQRQQRPTNVPWDPSSHEPLSVIEPSLVVDAIRRRGAVEQASRAFGPEPADPATSRALADFGGLGRLRQRPTLIDDTPDEQFALLQAERRVTVELHSEPSLGLSGLDTSQPPRRPG